MVQSRPERQGFVEVLVKEILYHGYTVTGTARHSDGTVWRSQTRISWSGKRQEVRLDDLNCYRSQREAEEHALTLGKHWVDSRLQGKL